MIHTHQTAPTQFVQANEIRFAYRRFGKTAGCLRASTSVHRHHGLLGPDGDGWPRSRP